MNYYMMKALLVEPFFVILKSPTSKYRMAAVRPELFFELFFADGMRRFAHL